MQTPELDWLAIVLAGEPVVDIGQIDARQRRALESAARKGAILKYRGCWNTLSPDWGLGPLKTIFAPLPPSVAAPSAVPTPPRNRGGRPVTCDALAIRAALADGAGASAVAKALGISRASVYRLRLASSQS